MDKLLIAAKRHLSSMEARIASQSALVQRLESAGTDATENGHNLEIMKHALESMRVALRELAAPNARLTDFQAVGERRRAPRRSARREAAA